MLPLVDSFLCLSRVLWGLFSPRTALCLVRFCWVIANNFYCIPAYFAYMLGFSPLLLIKPAWYWQIEETFFDWLLSMVACWSYTAGYSVVESGDRLDGLRGETALVMPNHQSTADVPLCMTIFTARRNFSSKVMWVMDKIFKYTNFGWVAWMHNDFFILAVRNLISLFYLTTKNHPIFLGTFCPC